MNQQILYRSISSVVPRSIEFARVYLDSRPKNRSLDVTGYLHYENGYFIQFLEGPQASIKEILNSIQNDFRHFNVQVLSDELAIQREFETWDMAFTDGGQRKFSSFFNKDIGTAPTHELLAFMLSGKLKFSRTA